MRGFIQEELFLAGSTVVFVPDIQNPSITHQFHEMPGLRCHGLVADTDAQTRHAPSPGVDGSFSRKTEQTSQLCVKIPIEHHTISEPPGIYSWSIRVGAAGVPSHRTASEEFLRHPRIILIPVRWRSA